MNIKCLLLIALSLLSLACLSGPHSQAQEADAGESEDTANAQDFSEQLAPFAFLTKRYAGGGTLGDTQLSAALAGEWELEKNAISITRSYNSTDLEQPAQTANLMLHYSASAKEVRITRFTPGTSDLFLPSESSGELIGDDGSAKRMWSFTTRDSASEIKLYQRSMKGRVTGVTWQETLPASDEMLTLEFLPSPGAQGPYQHQLFQTKIEPDGLGYSMKAMLFMPQDAHEEARLQAWREKHENEDDASEDEGDDSEPDSKAGVPPFAYRTWPVVVLSPGGAADSAQGYNSFGSWLASWGYITLVVAFDTDNADDRAPRFMHAVDWLEFQHKESSGMLNGRIDLDRIALAGHSLGGHAALLAAYSDERVKCVVGLAPSGPDELPELHQPATCVIAGSSDQYLQYSQGAFKAATGERYWFAVDGMDHFFQPQSGFYHTLYRMTAFLNSYLGDPEVRGYTSLLTAPSPHLEYAYHAEGEAESDAESEE